MSLNPLEILAFALMGAALLLGLVRFALGPATPDRLVAADTLSVITTAGLAGVAVLLDSPSTWTWPSCTGAVLRRRGGPRPRHRGDRS